MYRTGRRTLAVFLLSVMVLAGCTTGKPTTPDPQGGTPSPTPVAQTLVIAGGTTTVSMDIHKVSDSPSLSILEHINETLFSINEKGEISPRLAESFTPSADGLSYTIKLKSGVKFSDGTPFNSAAVKQNFERILNPDTKAGFRSLISLVTSIETPDETTVILKTSAPFAPLHAHLSHPGTAIIAPSALAKGDQYLANETIGTGPYKLKEYKKDQHVTLTPNESYRGPAAKLTDVTYKAVKEDGSRLVEIESGTTDIALRVPATEVARLKANANLEVKTVPGLRVIYIMFNNQKAPFNNPKLRQAINYAVDKDAIVANLLGGAGRPLDAPMATPVFGYSAQTPYKRDLTKAKQLLEESGFDKSQKIVLHHPTGRYAQDAKVAEAVAAQMKELGLNVELKTLEWAQYLAYTGKPLAETDMQMAMLGWSTPTMDADYALYELFHSSQWPDKNGFNRAFYKSDTVDQLLDKGRTTTDPAQRKTIYADAVKQIWSDAPWLFLYSEDQVYAQKKNVSGFSLHPSERVNWAGAERK